MAELHKFLFDGLPVRGALVRLTDAWTEMLRRRASNSETGAYPAPVRVMLGEMAAASVLLQSNIKFDGALVLQIFGAGPVSLAVVEVQPDLALRATATVRGALADDASLDTMVNAQGRGRCAITLDPRARLPGQQPYQGVVPLVDAHGAPLSRLSEVLQHYMLQSEQLDTTLVLAADDQTAAGLLVQRLPLAGAGNLAGGAVAHDQEKSLGQDDDYNRIAMLASSLQREELLTLDADTLLRRLFWEENLLRFPPLSGAQGPRFRCTCSRERVARMIESLGQDEVADILAERGQVEVGCEYCGLQYRFDAVDAAQLFVQPAQRGGGATGDQMN